MADKESGNSFIKNIIAQLEDSASVKRKMMVSCVDSIVSAAKLMIGTIKSGAKILLCGNGGSAADSQHLAAELVSKLKLERSAIPAIALTTNTSTLTAVANDYDFSQIFVRQLEAFGKRNDLLIGISTSGNSEDVLKAVDYAHKNGLRTIVMTGGNGGDLAGKGDVDIIVPSEDVQRIQEAHITVGHILCDILEQSIFGNR